MTNALPSDSQMLASLRAHGYQFDPARPRVALGYGGGEYKLDVNALGATPYRYGNSALATALKQHGLAIQSLQAAKTFLQDSFAKPGLIIGFSGFATARADYIEEAAGIIAIYESLCANSVKPFLTVDGCTSEGVPGLNGVIAKSFNVASLGYTPIIGLDDMGTRTHAIVDGDTYKDREFLVGATPDILFCVGGQDGARRECEHALANGGIVVTIKLRQYAASFVNDTSALQKAHGGVKLFACQSHADIPMQVNNAYRAALQHGVQTRDHRLGRIINALSN